jgi:hypothetical protein
LLSAVAADTQRADPSATADELGAVADLLGTVELSDMTVDQRLLVLTTTAELVLETPTVHAHFDGVLAELVQLRMRKRERFDERRRAIQEEYAERDKVLKAGAPSWPLVPSPPATSLAVPVPKRAPPTRIFHVLSLLEPSISVLPLEPSTSVLALEPSMSDLALEPSMSWRLNHPRPSWRLNRLCLFGCLNRLCSSWRVNHL